MKLLPSLVSHVVYNNNNWKGSVEKSLNAFWDHVSLNPDIELIVPGFNEWWKIWHSIYPNAPTQRTLEDTIL